MEEENNLGAEAILRAKIDERKREENEPSYQKLQEAVNRRKK
jgi:hypothetical protein